MSNSLIPMDELSKMATVLGKGKMFGKTPDELLPLLLIAQAEGKHPAIAVTEWDIIQGRPALNARSAQARFQSAGGCVQWIKRSDQECSAEFSHPQGGKVTISWNMDRAKQAGLTGKDNWRKFPAQMLSARVVAEGVRACFPACLSGFYLTEEVQDFDAPRRPVNVSNISIGGKPVETPVVIEAQEVQQEPDDVQRKTYDLLAEYGRQRPEETGDEVLRRLSKGKVGLDDLTTATVKIHKRLQDLLTQELNKSENNEEEVAI